MATEKPKKKDIRAPMNERPGIKYIANGNLSSLAAKKYVKERRTKLTGEVIAKDLLKGGERKRPGGAAPGERMAESHGIYAKYYTVDELAMSDAMMLGAVDDEIKLCRIRLVRTLRTEGLLLDTEEDMALKEMTETSIKLPGGKRTAFTTEIKKRFEKTDFGFLIDRLITRIESLEKTRNELMKLMAPPAEEQITRIQVEVVGAKSIRTDPQADDDGAPG
jgi:hypothetical protein